MLNTALGLLYSAQHNFNTVQAAIHHWRQYHRWNRQIWAASPDRFREQWLTTNGDVAQWSAFNGATWWKAVPSCYRLATNSSPDQVAPGRTDITYGPAPDAADEYYGIMDGHHAITAESALNPSYLISGLCMANIQRSVWADRPALRVAARPRAQAQSLWNWRDAQEYELFIDSERGVLLYLNAHNAEAVAMGHEIKWVQYDGPLPDRIFNPTANAETRVSVYRTPTRR